MRTGSVALPRVDRSSRQAPFIAAFSPYGAARNITLAACGRSDEHLCVVESESRGKQEGGVTGCSVLGG